MTETPEIENMDDRLTQEVTLLSTKLVTAVAKQLELEEKLLHMHRDNTQLKQKLGKLGDIETKYNEVVSKHEELTKEHEKVKQLKDTAEAQNTKLLGEVEDLTASLFNEANEMVSNASREAYNFKVKNRKLNEEIEEKNTIIDNLQDQLKDLKQLFFRIEEQHKLTFSGTGTPKLEQSNHLDDENKNNTEEDVDSNPQKYAKQLETIIYSPNVGAIRFDLSQYQQDFKVFIYTIIKPEFHMDLTALKNLKFFRSVWSEELENSFPIIPNLANSNFINRWQKGKNFWNLIVEGKAVIEPISGVNETFKLAYKGDKLNKDVPVATKDPCSFCGQSKDDILEHSRLYSLKLLNPDSSSANTESQDVIVSYPLCNYCLIKLRTICDFFAKIRLISSNVYKLKQNTQFEEATTPNFQFKRSFNGSSDLEVNSSPKNKQVLTKEEEEIEECKVMKLYFILNLIRSKIFWSKLGFWDNVENVHEINIEDLNHEAFRSLIRKPVQDNANENSQPSTPTLPNQPDSTTASSVPKLGNDTSKNIKDVSDISVDTDKSKSTKDPASKPTKPQELSEENELADSYGKDLEPSSDKDNDEFADTSENFQDSEDQVLANDTSDTKQQLGRKNSKSKQFKQKIDNDLDQTLQMLQESINDE
ncbi:uncharacterized protein AC631_00040 [Debaryomyces fabryi]|uniref:GDP/GTP exchange factor Sec2 N-terminal domain-containing protein n=1 Tax=Debaryomyces fabryi TaxID=58627 RepID=A0A0V1Q6W7_9ASCO|nr:uncharacterized protein AC631_00040 [Debaryomyces fabryi]KSA04169.1 hypothetical protein AC631_00040 [Debaryomyces fabryi]CUM46225.1 unnamed protein product [Debaryomyces fabryi]